MRGPKFVKDMLYNLRYVFFLTLLVFAMAAAAYGDATPRVVVIVAGNVSFRDVANPRNKNICSLIDKGSAGLMNVRSGRLTKNNEPTKQAAIASGYLSLGAGAMASGGAEVKRAANASDISTRDLYLFRTGNEVSQANVIHTEIAKINKINADASYHAKPGALGTLLRSAGIKTAVIGNSDIPGEIHREAVAIAMDDMGVVDCGDVSSADLREVDPKAAYGIRANTGRLLYELDEVLPDSGFIVIDFGDTARADNYAKLCSEAKAVELRNNAVERLDRFVGDVAGRLDLEKDLFILISPSPRTYSDLRGERLGFAIINGPGFGKGCLTSPSTRRRGVITISDIAPTVLGFAGVNPSADIVGRRAYSLPDNDSANMLLSLNEDASKQAQRQVIMRGSSVVQSVLVVLVTLVVMLMSVRKLKEYASWIALAPAIIPLAMLYMPVIYRGGLVGSVFLLIGLSLLVLIALTRIFKSPMQAFCCVCGLLVLSLMADLFRGSPLIRSAIAGYGLVEGARYYGVGNELMGTMLGAGIAGVGLVLASGKIKGRLRGIFAAVIFALVFVFIGFPALGANVGGALATVPGVAVVLLLRRGWRPNIKGVVTVAVSTVVIVGGLFLLDFLRSGGSQSHMGHVLRLFTGGDLGSIFVVFQRKILLNMMLLSTSLWSRLLGLSLVCSAVLYWRGHKLKGNEFLDNERKAAVIGCAIGTAGAFVFNDSGVVAAATCSVFIWIMLVLSLVNRQKNLPGIEINPRQA